MFESRHNLVPAGARVCADCGAPLDAAQVQPICPACIFRRLSAGAVAPAEDVAGGGLTAATVAVAGDGVVPSEAGAGAGAGGGERVGEGEVRGGETGMSARALVWNQGLRDEAETDFLSEYELLGEIGRGGMGVIYKAHQPGLNRVVALKVVHAAGLAGEGARRRFQSEVKVAGRLNHPNIVPVFDVGVMDGCPCFSMEYFPGGSLADWLRRPGRAVEDGVRLLVKVARAVSFAHQRGVLHRDLKPGNILLDAAGEPHVADFGLAKELDGASHLTHSGAVLGSPNYMSPEQASGRSDALTVATDIYSLGAVLYELLAGRPPFVAATPLETMRLVVEQEAQRPSTISGRADRDLEIICLKCLDKDPGRRYATAAEMAADLERWLRHEPIQARSASQLERLGKWMRRHPTLAGMSGLLLIVLVAGLAGVTWQWRQADRARRSEVEQRQRAEAALARSALALAEAALRDGNGPGVQSALSTVPPPLRDATWNYFHGESDTSRLLSVPGVPVLAIDQLVADPTRPSVFVAALRTGRIVVVEARGGAILAEWAPGFAQAATNVPLRLAVSPSGEWLAVGRGGPGGIVLHRMADGAVGSEWGAPQSERLEFSPDGKLVLQVAAYRVGLHLWAVEDGTRVWSRRDEYLEGRFVKDGSRVAVYGWNRGLQIEPVEADGATLGLRGHYLDTFAVPGDGGVLVAGNPLGFVRGFSTADGQVLFEVQAHDSRIERLEFLPGDDRFLTASALEDGLMALQIWDVRTGRLLHRLLGGGGSIRALMVHPLSGELVVAGRDLRVWQTVSVPPLLVLRGGNAHPSAVFWGGPDTLFAPAPGQFGAALQVRPELMAGAGGRGALVLERAKPRVLWTPMTQDHGQPSVSADGRRVAMGRYGSTHGIEVLERGAKKLEVRRVRTVNPSVVLGYVRLDPTGDRLGVVDSTFANLEIRNVADGKRSVTLERADITRFNDLAWLDGGRRLAGLVTRRAPRSQSGSEEEVALWDTVSGRLLRTARADGYLNVACAAPDGRSFAEGGADRVIRVRDAETLAVRQEFRAHNAPISALAWHPTRPILATAGQDLIIRLWDTRTGARLEELRGPLSPPTVLSFSEDGRRLATAARDQAVRVWEPRALAAEPH